MTGLPGRQLPRGRHPVLARHLPPGGQRRPDAVHRLRLLRPERRLPRRAASSRAPTAATTWAGHRRRDGHQQRSATTAARSASTTTSSSPTRPTRTSSTCSARTATTTARRRAASSARPTAARPGRTSATTCTRTSTPSPSSRTTPRTSPSATTAASGSRTPAVVATAPAIRCRAADWQNLNGQVNPNTAVLVHSTGLAIAQFTLDRDRAAHPRPVLGRHPGQRHPAQVARQQPVVRPGER